MATTRGAAHAPTWRRRRPRACCARAWATTSRCRRWPTARRSITTACASACIRPATCWARRRFASSTPARSGSRRATTSSPARPTTRTNNPTCAPFEPVRCDCFITESTFGLPIYRWRPQREVFADDRCLVARQRRSRPRQPADGLQLRQGAAHAGRRRRVDRADRRARRGRAAEPRLPRGRRRAAADACASPTSPTRRLLQARARDRAAVGAGLAVGAALRRLRATRSRAAGCSCAARAGGAASTAASSSATTPTGPACSARSPRRGAERVIVTHGYEAVMVRWLEQQGLQAGAFSTEYGRRRRAARQRRAAADASERGRAGRRTVTDAEAARAIARRGTRRSRDDRDVPCAERPMRHAASRRDRAHEALRAPLRRARREHRDARARSMR